MDYEELESKCQWLEAQNAALLELLGECETQVVMRMIELQGKIDSFMARENPVLADIYRDEIVTTRVLLTRIEQIQKEGGK